MQRQRLFYHSKLAGLLVLIAVAGFFLIRFDRTIAHKFDSKRFRLASRVYARPLELHPGKMINVKYLKKELLALGYHENAHPQKVGQFVLTKNTLTIYRRGFVFYDGKEDPLKFTIKLTDGTITQITTANGQLDMVRLDPLGIGGIYPNNFEDREMVKIEIVPRPLLDGLILLEDKDFYYHNGLDITAICRAAWHNLIAGKVAEGGSTLTQQMVKNLYLTNERSMHRKLYEAVYALLLELHYSKNEILETYINEVYFGKDGPIEIHGFALAASYYFGKTLEELTINEQAMLIAMLNGPAYFDPRHHPARLLARRNKVLTLLKEAAKIDDKQYAAAMTAKIAIAPQPGYFFGAYLDLVKQHLARDYSDSDLAESGLKIHTSFNPVTQWIVGQAVDELFIKPYKKAKELNIAVVVTTLDGEVEAMVGGKAPFRLGFNHALKAVRSIGSLIKPITALTALENSSEFSLMTLLDDNPANIVLDDKRVWTPQNFDHQSHGLVPLHEMVAYSYNLAEVNLGQKIGVPALGKTITRLLDEKVDTDNPSAFLGSWGFTPYQVSQIYQTIANDGFRSPLKSVRQVQNRDLKPLKSFPLKTERVFAAETTYLVKFAMREVITHGTGRGAARWLNADSYAAGKTGTSSDGRDLWFAGFNDQNVVVVWIGNDNNTPTSLSGGVAAMPIFAKIMSELNPHAQQPPQPAGISLTSVHQKTGAQIDASCPDAIVIPFIQGHEPAQKTGCSGSPSILDKLIEKLKLR